MSEKLAIIILAAGNSSRLGQAKQLVTLNGESLLSRQCKMAKTLSENVSCVFGYQAQKMVDEITGLGIKSVINDDWQSGLSSSIAIGVSAIDDDIDAVMLILVDQWQLSHKHYQDIYQYWKNNPLNIISAAESIKGLNVTTPPVIFPAHCFSQLKELNQGNGAKSVIKKYQNQLLCLLMPEAFVDLDTPEQLEMLGNYQLNQQKN
jgi:molybdenum cofactor cytidylyltransferase